MQHATYNLESLAAILRANTTKNLDRSRSGADIGAIVCIESVEQGNLRLAEFKMVTKVGRKAAAAYKTEKEAQYYASLRK